MDEKMIEIFFGIIGFVGDVKGLVFEVIKEVKSGNIDKVRECIEKLKELIYKVYKF